MGCQASSSALRFTRRRWDVLIAYWEAEDIERVVREMAESQDLFDVWFREGVLEFHSVNLSQGTLRNPPEKFLDWQAD